ncbi:MAG: hypothetical protein H6853_00320 [Rhodospirillales bacterium]|nr:hypothetical protein [Alphaproteobacteria bacterium]USO03771.1 MAG: hypothetical protein H6853_00320 [Rhodospirillales bacterium]
MGRFGRSGGGSSSGGLGGRTEQLVGTVVDKKVAPRNGQKRVIVNKKGGGRKMVAVDMSAREADKLERKGTYRFEVEEKESTRDGGSQRRRSSSSFRSYQCEGTPERHTGSSTGEDRFNRFNSGGTGSDTSGRRGGRGHDFYS